jgi:hypothetical protein
MDTIDVSVSEPGTQSVNSKVIYVLTSASCFGVEGKQIVGLRRGHADGKQASQKWRQMKRMNRMDKQPAPNGENSFPMPSRSSIL